MKNKMSSLGFTLVGTLIGCLVLLVGLQGDSSATGYWQKGKAEETNREQIPNDGGGEYDIVEWSLGYVRFHVYSYINRLHTRLYLKWSGPTIIVPGEAPNISVSYEASGPQFGGLSASFCRPGGNCSLYFLGPGDGSTSVDAGLHLGANSPPAGQLVNKVKVPTSFTGDFDLIYRSNVGGGLVYQVTVHYKWMEGTPPRDDKPTGDPAAIPSSYPHVVVAADGNLNPAPGYTWETKEPGDYRVRWSPGCEHSDAPHVLAGSREEEWVPAPGYEWVTTEAGDLRVKPMDCTQEVMLYTNNNIFGIANGPTQPTRFTLNAATKISFLLTYHWNNGRGQPPGSVGLQHEDGTRYGPWRAVGAPGSGGVANAYWIARPQVVVKPGTYTVFDSHEASWGQNAQSNGRGIVEVKGCVVR